MDSIRKGSDMCRMKLVMAAAIAAVAVQLLCVHTASAATPGAAAAEDTAPKPPIKRADAGADGATVRTALVVQDNVAMRASARDGAPAQAQLWRGEALEIRGERPDHFQVYDYRRERGGYVRKAALLPLAGPAAQPQALLAALRVVRQQTGAESLGLGLAAAYIQAASAEQVNGADGAEALDAMGTLAERLADRASRAQPRPDGAATAAEAQVAAQLDVAARYGLRFRTLERDAGAMQLCYDGEAFRRVLAMPASTPEQKARAALALTRTDCLDPAATPPQREQMDQWRADVLDKVDLRDPMLATHWRNRVLMRQSGVWSSLAFIRARRAGAAVAASAASAASIASTPSTSGIAAVASKATASPGTAGATAATPVPALQVDASSSASRRALEAFARIVPAELSEDDQPAYNDAAMRGNAMRWAALPAAASTQTLAGVTLTVLPGQPGETCLTLALNGAREGASPLLRHCAWGLVMTASARINREGNAIAIASVPADGWRELWLLRRTPQGWRVSVLPPVAAQPGLGYAEFAGWVPGGRELLVARESRAEGRYKRSYEQVDLDTLETKRQAGDAAMLGAFQRWQAADWKGASLSLR
ncbi:hypothetical protein [Mitsuaria sp. GD03876]|uniref:hypothetical protein n=1 Tax=Mitsuaria sp. GD03876 TaxID=2975399 RepID=UPI00244BF57C|nr:hypothetical protein [Mitsuaria sp. GD03876]MDH0864018.1 hypothetical protein [Mitsuaria sp. GD03876]